MNDIIIYLLNMNFYHGISAVALASRLSVKRIKHLKTKFSKNHVNSDASIPAWNELSKEWHSHPSFTFHTPVNLSTTSVSESKPCDNLVLLDVSIKRC